MNCKNCETNLNRTHKFCHECGAKVIHDRLTIKTILYNFSVQFFNYDNKIFKTFVHLFTKPEEVIVGYIDGVRKRYINVIQYFAISLTIVGIQFFIFITFFESPFEFKPESFGIDNNVPNKESVERIMASVSEFMNNFYSLINIISIPFSAIGSWVVYKLYVKKYNYAEHIVINTYYAAQLSIVSSLLAIIFVCFGVSYMDFSFFIMPVIFIYFWYILKRIYNMSILDSIAYMMLYTIAYFIIFILIGIISFIMGLLIGMMLK